MSITVIEQGPPKIIDNGPGYAEVLAAESRLARITTAVDAIAINPKTGQQRLVKIRMRHGGIVDAGRQNAINAIERGDAELLDGQSDAPAAKPGRKK
jgi:hypothetical protein